MRRCGRLRTAAECHSDGQNIAAELGIAGWQNGAIVHFSLGKYTGDSNIASGISSKVMDEGRSSPPWPSLHRQSFPWLFFLWGGASISRTFDWNDIDCSPLDTMSLRSRSSSCMAFLVEVPDDDLRRGDPALMRDGLGWSLPCGLHSVGLLIVRVGDLCGCCFSYLSFSCEDKNNIHISY